MKHTRTYILEHLLIFEQSASYLSFFAERPSFTEHSGQPRMIISILHNLLVATCPASGRPPSGPMCVWHFFHSNEQSRPCLPHSHQVGCDGADTAGWKGWVL